MLSQFCKISSVIGLSLLFAFCSACQHKGKRTPIISDPDDGITIPITNGLISSDLKGLWGSECWVGPNGPERLHLSFERGEVTVDRSMDPEHPDCGNDGLRSAMLHVAFRFKWTSGDWIPEKPFFRSAKIELVQILARSDSDSLTLKFNEARQCGFDQWKTNKYHDVSNANCQGSISALKFTWPLAVPASINSIFLIENNQLKILNADESVEHPLMPIFSAPGPVSASRYGYRDISAKFWNNEKPDIGSFVFSQDISLENLPLMEGEGSFRGQQEPKTGYFSIKNGVMKVRISLYNILRGPYFSMKPSSFLDKVSGDYITMGSSETDQLIVFTKGSTMIGTVAAPALPKRGSSFDLKAPDLKLLEAPSRIVANEPFELKISAPDDLSGLGMFKLEALCGNRPEIVPMKSMRYEGQGIYWGRFDVINTREKECTKVVTLLAFDRVGREAMLKVDLPVEPLP